MKKVIVIGAGHGGLAAAARLKVKGFEVTVFEESNAVVTIDQELTLIAAYRDLFLKTGTAIDEIVELNEIPTTLNLKLSNGQSLQIPGSGIGRTIAEIEKKLGKESAKQWQDYLLELSNLWQKSRNLLLDRSQVTFSEVLKAVGIRSWLKFVSYQRLIKRHLRDPALVELADEYREQTASAKDSNIGLIALNCYLQSVFGVYQVTGGLIALSQALFERCKKLGVEFEFNTHAAPITIGNDLIGVENSTGELISAHYVIVNDLKPETITINWRNMPTLLTASNGLFRIPEHSWLGIGPAQAVLNAEIIAEKIGSANS
jgi:phytoene dehydrogenase-like protein